MTNKIRTRTWALIGVGIIGVVAIALIASSGDDPTAKGTGASANSVDGTSESIAADPTDDTGAGPDATANPTDDSAAPGGTSTGLVTTTIGGQPGAVTTTTSAAGGPVATNGANTTNLNVPTTIAIAAGPGATTIPSAAAPGTTSSSLQLFFLKVSTGQCDATGHFSWSVNFLSTLTPVADPAPDRIVHNPTNARMWDMYWTATSNGHFTSPSTIISAGQQSFTVPIGEAPQPTNCG